MKPRSDVHYRCIADARRREILRYLREHQSGAKSLDDLVDHVVPADSDTTAPDRETVAVALYHHHLPLLDDAGVVDFDGRSKTVRYTGHAGVESLLDAHDDPAPSGTLERSE